MFLASTPKVTLMCIYGWGVQFKGPEKRDDARSGPTTTAATTGQLHTGHLPATTCACISLINAHPLQK